MLNGQIKYMVLAFLTYAVSQSRETLRTIYKLAILPQISPYVDHRSYSRSIPAATVLNGPHRTRIMWDLVRLLPKAADLVTIELFSFLCIFLSYVGFISPLIFSAWFFVFSGVFWIIAEIAYKFFFLVPHQRHVKNV